MLKTNWYARLAPLVMLLTVAALPLLLYGVRGALRGGSNDVRQWLPAGFEETRQYDWFLERFGSEEMAVVSWPGATLADERIERVATALQNHVGEEAADSTSAAPKLFKRVTSTPQAIDELLARIQNELFDLGAELATPRPAEARM